MKILKGEEHLDQSADWHEGFEMGVRSVLAIRCISHRETPLLNDEAGGPECPICAFEAFRGEVTAIGGRS